MQTLSSKVVAEMLGKRHDNFLRNLRKYVSILGEGASEYFIESTYKDMLGKKRCNYEITCKGCEFIAGRIIGVKSDKFKASYKAIFSEEIEPVNDSVKGFTTAEVAEKLNCSRRTVQRMIQRGDLKAIKITVNVPKEVTVITPDELESYRQRRDQA